MYYTNEEDYSAETPRNGSYSVSDPRYWTHKQYLEDNLSTLARENTDRMQNYNKNNLNTDSDVNVIDDYKEVANDTIIDTIWNKVFYISSMTGPAVTTTSASELFSSSTRESDTSSGKYLSVNRPCKFRCLFYFNSTDALDSTAYIGTVGTYTTDTGITSINQTGMEYVALKVVNGLVYISSKNEIGNTNKNTGRIISDDTTYILEIDFSPRERVDFYLDDDYLGSITETLPGLTVNPVTFFPLMVSLKRTSGTDRKITVESWEFIQTKK